MNILKRVIRAVVNTLYLLTVPFFYGVVAVFSAFLYIFEELRVKNGVSRYLIKGECFFWNE